MVLRLWFWLAGLAFESIEVVIDRDRRWREREREREIYNNLYCSYIILLCCIKKKNRDVEFIVKWDGIIDKIVF